MTNGRPAIPLTVGGASLDSIRSLLRTHSFTAELSDAQITELASIAGVVHFAPGEFALRAGEPAGGLYLIVTGTATVEMSLSACTAGVQYLGTGDVFGWSSVLGNAESLFQVRAANSLLTVRLDGAQLLHICRSDHELGVAVLHRLLAVVAGRVRASEEQFARLLGAGHVVEPKLSTRRVRRRSRE